MAAGKIDTKYHSVSNSALKRNTFTSCGPFSFIRQTKQILEEIEEKKESLHENLALELRSTKTSEFYDVIDSLPENEEVFEVLRIKQLVRDSIQSADKEIQVLIKQLKNESKQNDFQDSRTSSGDTDSKHQKLLSNTSVRSSPSSSLHLKQNSKNKPMRPNSLKCFIATKKKPVFDLKKKELGFKGTHHFVTSSTHTLEYQRSSSVPQVNTKSLLIGRCAPEEQTTEAQYLPAISGVSIPRNATLLQKSKPANIPNLNIRNHEASNDIGICSEKSKYFPSAVPLAPPSRQKSLERTADSMGKANVMRRCNVAVVTVQSHEINTGNLKCQVLPSMSIEGKSKISSCQGSNVKNILFQEELSEGGATSWHPENPNVTKLPLCTTASVQNLNQKQGGDSKPKHSFSGINSFDCRLGSELLHEGSESHGLQEKSESKIESEEKVSREILESLILDVVREDLWNICSELRKNCPLPVLQSNLSSSVVKAVLDVETQVQSSLIELIDQEVQATVEHPELISECIQTSLSVKQVETVSACIQVSHILEPAVLNESLSAAPVVTGIDVGVQTSVETCNTESDVKHKSLLELHSGISSCNSPALDLNFSLPIVTATHDVNCGNESLLSFQEDKDEQKFSVCTPPESAGKLFSPSEIHVLELEQMTPQHNQMQNDFDVSPQKEKRLDVLHKTSNSEQSLSEKTSGAAISASTTITDSDLMEDLISEGECILHSHLRLLSLLGRNIISTSPKRNQGKEAGECSLSEGEIPIRNWNKSANDHINFSTTTLTGRHTVSVNSERNHEKEVAETSLSEGELPFRNLNRLVDNQRNFPTITLTDHFEESVPVKLASEKSSLSSNGTFCHCASNGSEGEVYPHYTACSPKNGSHCSGLHDEDQVLSVTGEREFGSNPVVHHL